MIYKLILCSCILWSSAFLFAQKAQPFRVIFDSDMGPDYDDVGAITLLHAFADSGKAKILATMASTKYEGVAGVLNVFNTYFKRPNLPIGVPKGEASTARDSQHWTDTVLTKYPHAVKTNNDVPDAVDLYRKILAAQPNHSVTIITVGFFTNLAHLMQSKPDQYSKLSGEELVHQKVKQLVSMAGKFPSGKEYNVFMDAAASKHVFGRLQVPVIFSGSEIGEKIKTGLPLIQNNSIVNSPVKDVFRICIPKSKEDSAGRMSWDETAVLVAIKGYAPYYTLKKGKMKVAVDGSNSWSNDSVLQAYLVEKESPKKVQGLINQLMMHEPLVKSLKSISKN